MRTIKEIHRDRLVAEAEEADIVGFSKIAENLTKQIEKTAVRDNEESYSYNESSFYDDIQERLWDIVIRTADFHDTYIDSEKAQNLVDIYSDKIIYDLRKVAKVSTNIGAYEDSVLGEQKYIEVIDIEE